MKLDRPLAGERIVIRSYAPEDLDFCTGMWFDPENGRYLSDPAREYVDEVFQRALDGLQDSGDGYYLVVKGGYDAYIRATSQLFFVNKALKHDIHMVFFEGCFLHHFTAYLRKEERSAATIEKYIREAGRFLRWLDGRTAGKELAARFRSPAPLYIAAVFFAVFPAERQAGFSPCYTPRPVPAARPLR